MLLVTNELVELMRWKYQNTGMKMKPRLLNIVVLLRYWYSFSDLFYLLLWTFCKMSLKVDALYQIFCELKFL